MGFSDEAGEDHLEFLVFPDQVVYHISRENAAADVEAMVKHADGDAEQKVKTTAMAKDKHFVFVCAHAKMDNRCGYCGPRLVTAFQEHLAGAGLADRTTVHKVTHVGGHKVRLLLPCHIPLSVPFLSYFLLWPLSALASILLSLCNVHIFPVSLCHTEGSLFECRHVYALPVAVWLPDTDQYAGNVIVFPAGEWYGYVKPEQVGTVVQASITDLEANGSPTILKEIWRGRMGLGKEEVKELAA